MNSDNGITITAGMDAYLNPDGMIDYIKKLEEENKLYKQLYDEIIGVYEPSGNYGNEYLHYRMKEVVERHERIGQ